MKPFFSAFLVSLFALTVVFADSTPCPAKGFYAAVELGAGKAKPTYDGEDGRFKEEYTTWPSSKLLAGYRFDGHAFRLAWTREAHRDAEVIEFVTLGYRYDFIDFPIYEDKNTAWLPLLSIDLGRAVAREQAIRGYAGEIGAGFSMVVSPSFSVSLLFARSIVFWDSHIYNGVELRQLDEAAFRVGLEWCFGGGE